MHYVQSPADVPQRYQRTTDRVAVSTRIIVEEQQQAPPARRAYQDAAAVPAARAADVVVYTAPWCGWCRKTMEWLDERNVDYTNKDIEANPDHARELRAKTGASSIPVVEIGSETIRGYSPQRMRQALEL